MVIERGIVIPAFRVYEDVMVDEDISEIDELIQRGEGEPIPIQPQLINTTFYNIETITPASNPYYGEYCSIIVSSGIEYFTNVNPDRIHERISKLKREEKLLYISN